MNNSTKAGSAIRIHNMSTYLHDTMLQDLSSFKTSSGFKTGFTNLDCQTSLYPGLYVLGAGTSLGKTTFALQLCDQIAMSGHAVLFFSLEQTTLELATKSLSRIMAQKSHFNAMTALDIRCNGDDPRVSEAKRIYSQYSSNITVVECGFDSCIQDVEAYVNAHISEYNRKPIVIIDYLQIMKSSDRKLSTREAVELNVARLKQLQMKHKLVMLVISSFNRQNYMETVDYESYKETGLIDYSADVLWGLQLSAIKEDDFCKTNTNAKRERYQQAKSEIPRKIDLVCIKNRFGISSYSASFNYYPQYDLFIPCDSLI